MVAGPLLQFVGPRQNLQIDGITMLGVNANNGRKLLFTLIFLVGLYLVAKLLRGIAAAFGGDRQKVAFWTRQGISLLLFLVAVIGLVSIWFDNPSKLGTAAGLIGAGLAFAMQKVVTSFAGYWVILRGQTFNVGDRITMGGVRGDVIALNFIQTTIMEMGEPPAVQQDDPGMWVHSRQYSGRIVTISNSAIFDQPVYNYTRDFPYMWEEMHIPVSYKDDWHRAEKIIVDAVAHHTTEIANMAQPEQQRLKERFFIAAEDLHPRVYVRLTDNWLELSVRFLCPTHDVRALKDRISREMLAGLDAAKIGIASSTYDIVGMPPLRVETVQVAMPGQQEPGSAAVIRPQLPNS